MQINLTKIFNKNSPASLFSIFIVLIAALIFRFNYFSSNSINGYNATSWDAFGYYMYQPGLIIYDDVKKLEWLPQIDSTYHVTGGELYQAHKIDNGNFVFKYLGGVCIFQLPFFIIGHTIADYFNVIQDGFSWPYQYSIMFGAIFWFFIGLFFLRSTLLKYFSDEIVSITILLIFLATNLPQYISIDGAMSHSWIFPLYCFVIWLSDKWHDNPSINLSFLIGITCGLAIISRPTELIMLFIPVLWSSKSVSMSSKWALIKSNWKLLLFAVIGGLIGILPQLIYWKYVTGNFIYDVGSKWYFLNPWFRVLFGFYSGWFVYTPITIVYIIGFWFMKDKPFKMSVITFCLLNIWIITAWSDWKYGVSYSGRALSQASPIYALSLAAFLDRFYQGKLKYYIVLISLVLILINIYQIKIYNSGTYDNFSVIQKILN